ncbi:hypothetical protein EV421DRAFT_1739933 [Armillaria borealis]|uniref:Uncharacterized protein n=1 Tax=Armillaria borealis TaxID=47425 RepID=A0AA39MJ87_9AGAR|nr:hypothetical protein EV421DRAFT_1739933 [Armillaria borealis]
MSDTNNDAKVASDLSQTRSSGQQHWMFKSTPSFTYTPLFHPLKGRTRFSLWSRGVFGVGTTDRETVEWNWVAVAIRPQQRVGLIRAKLRGTGGGLSTTLMTALTRADLCLHPHENPGKQSASETRSGDIREAPGGHAMVVRCRAFHHLRPPLVCARKSYWRMEATKIREEENRASHCPDTPLPPHSPATGPTQVLPPSPPLHPAPDTSDVKSVETDELPDVPKNKKGWLKGRALEFLERNHLLHFMELYEDSPVQTKEYADTACNDLHMHFDFHLLMNVPPKKPYDPKEPLSKWDELLRTTIIAWDRVSVFNWLCKEVMKVHGSKKAKLVTAKSGADTMDILLGRLNGIEPGTLKGTAPYQLWAKEEGKEDREAAHMSLLFAALPKETQKAYKARVAEGKAKAQEDRDQLRRLMEDPLLPLEAQQLIDCFGGETIRNEDLDGHGQAGTMKRSQNSGKDKSTIPVKFSRNEARYHQCLEVFGEFLVEGYNKEDELACTLPSDKESKDAAESSGSVPYKEMDILNGLLQLEEEHFSDEDEVEMAPAAKKKGGWAAKSATETMGETSQKGKRKRPADDGKVSTKKAKIVGGGQANFTETSVGSRGKKKKETVLKKVVVGIGKSSAKIAGAAIDPQLKGLDSLLATWRASQIASPRAGRSSQKGFDSAPPSPMKSISFGRIPIFGLNDMPNPFEGSSVMLPVQRQKPTLSPEDATSLEEGHWPPWFKQARETLKSELLSSLGDCWDDLMWFWTLTEGRQGFKMSCVSIGPQSAGDLHPVEVGNQLKWGHRMEYVPELGRKDLKSLGDSWWVWWKVLQLDWRGVSGVDGCLHADHQIGDGEWEHL